MFTQARIPNSHARLLLTYRDSAGCTSNDSPGLPTLETEASPAVVAAPGPKPVRLLLEGNTDPPTHPLTAKHVRRGKASTPCCICRNGRGTRAVSLYRASSWVINAEIQDSPAP